MKIQPLRIIIFSTTLIIAVIIFFQLSWLKKVYTYEEKEFNGKVVNSVNELKSQFVEIKSHGGPRKIERPAESTYILPLSAEINNDSLGYYFERILEKEELYIDCELAVYDPSTGKFRYQVYLKGPGSVQLTDTSRQLKHFSRSYPYLLIDFPNRSNYILKRLDNWILSSFLLIVALVTLLVLLINFLRQRYVIRFQRDFVNNIVHEFKTPLAVMKIASEVLNKERIAEQPDRLKKYAEIVDNQTRHLEQQVHRILEMMRSENYKIQVTPSLIDTKEFVSQAITKLQPLIEDRKGQLRVDIDPDASTFTGDYAHLELALVNLIENALKYSRHPEIVITVRNVQRNTIISVNDNGIGIEKKYYSLLFNKFYRVPSGDIHNEKGFGLGLNFVKKVVDAHKGKISVTSEQDKGTNFTLMIPQ